MTPQDYERMCERHDEEMARKDARIAELTAALTESNTLLGSMPIYKENPRVVAAIEANRRALAAVGEKKWMSFSLPVGHRPTDDSEQPAKKMGGVWVSHRQLEWLDARKAQTGLPYNDIIARCIAYAVENETP